MRTIILMCRHLLHSLASPNIISAGMCLLCACVQAVVREGYNICIGLTRIASVLEYSLPHTVCSNHEARSSDTYDAPHYAMTLSCSSAQDFAYSSTRVLETRVLETRVLETRTLGVGLCSIKHTCRLLFFFVKCLLPPTCLRDFAALPAPQRCSVALPRACGYT